jgi:hypothetical protein
MTEQNKTKRLIGVHFRTKQPTMVAFLDLENPKKKPSIHELKGPDDRRDFLFADLPTKYRKVREEDDLNECVLPHGEILLARKYKPWQIKAKSLDEWQAKNEGITPPKNLIFELGKKKFIATHVPVEFDGLKEGDKVLMILGGPGDVFCYAITNLSTTKWGESALWRIPAGVFSDMRGFRDKDKDCLFLIELYQEKPELFHPVLPQDREYILTSVKFGRRDFIQDQRIACSQRIALKYEDDILLDEKALFPEGWLQGELDEIKATDTALQRLIEDEKRCNKELKAAVHALPVWRKVFENIPGCGERIAGGIVAMVGNIRRFFTSDEKREVFIYRTVARIRKFCGAHVRPDGSFPRKRSGERLDHNPGARQSLVQMGDQFIYGKRTHWGIRCRLNKLKYKEKFPKICCSTCVKNTREKIKKDFMKKYREDLREEYRKKYGEKLSATRQRELGTALKKLPPDHQDELNTILRELDEREYLFTKDCDKKGHKKMFTPSHLLKKAIWQTLGQWIEYVAKKWIILEIDGDIPEEPEQFPTGFPEEPSQEIKDFLKEHKISWEVVKKKAS